MNKREDRFTTLKPDFSLKRFFFRWEWMLVLVIVIVIIINGSLSSKNYTLGTVLDSFKMYLDKSFLVFSMAFVILIGGIDISVASTIALSGTVMGVAYVSGVPMIPAMVLCLLTGLICGMINGWLITKFKELAPMILTLGTLSLFRGTAWIVLEDQSAGGFPDWYYQVSNGTAFTIGDVNVPTILICFLVCVVIFCYVLHKTSFGKKLYIIGYNAEAARYSTIKVERIKFIVYTLSGLMAAVSAIFLTSRISTVRPNIAQNYELEVIAIVVLGGFKTSGGVGNMLGPSLAMILIALIRFGLGRVGVRPEIILVIVGALLIISILLPNIVSMVSNKKKSRLVEAKQLK